MNCTDAKWLVSLIKGFNIESISGITELNSLRFVRASSNTRKRCLQIEEVVGRQFYGATQKIPKGGSLSDLKRNS